ncbi:tellurite resistance TerB family protein [Pararhizobium mangrovi]|nr:TerB N-terminal domain-containing protein [Pararhizobium mangrovi]
MAAIAARQQAQKASVRHTKRIQGWIPFGDSTSVAGRDLGGLIYVGTPPSLSDGGYGQKCRAYIDPSLPVARPGLDRDGREMPYWPGYSNIPARCRATYLDWLAGGRTDRSRDPGYMFLYFYGLERRFFVDNPSDEERQQIVDEVRRLVQLYADNGSVQRYLGEFIDIAQVATMEIEAIEPIFERSGWDLPLSLRIAIGTRIGREEPLDARWMASWLFCHPEHSLRTAATRCRDEFLALFRIRFGERFPDGLKVNKPKRVLKATYRAASSEFTGTLAPTVDDKPIPDIGRLRKPVEIAQSIADEVMDELDKLSRFLGRRPDERSSAAAHALLPAKLRPLFPSAELEALRGWAADRVAEGGFVTLADAIERLEGERPGKIGKRQFTGAADALARTGFGLAPDPRFALRSPKPDEPVVVFDLGERVEKLEDVSHRYRSVLMEIALGSFVAHANGHVADGERQSLEERIASSDGLNDQERRRLAANLAWFLAVPPDMSLLRRKLKDMAERDETAIRAALVAAARSDGTIHAEEVASLERVYKALGLDANRVYSDLHSGDLADTLPVVRAARTGAPGEAIPGDRDHAGPMLDTSRIAAIRSDTQRVSSVLGEIFDIEEEDDVPDVEAGLPGGLDRNHAALVRALITMPHWSEEEFAELCERHSLLASGSLETINEWGFERYDEALLDEYEGYDITPEVAAAIGRETIGERGNVETETA